MFRLFPYLIILLISSSCGEKDMDTNNSGNDPTFAVDIGSSEIPYVVIDVNETILNEPKVAASMEIYVQKELIQKQRIGIEYRGSTSFRLSDKKSFGMETWDATNEDMDVSFFGMPKEEDWILNGHVVNSTEVWDPSMLRNVLAYGLYRKMGNYASRTQFVELEINGVYLGVYVFMEKLKKNSERIAITTLGNADTDASGGYILKIDKTTGGAENIGKPYEYFLNNWDDDARYTETNSFRSQYGIDRGLLTTVPYGSPYHAQQYNETYFLYEYPKYDLITSEQKTFISEYIHSFETALLQDDFNSEIRTYTNYIDLDSFVDMFIINELCRNVDGYRLSTFLYKDKGGKLNIGPPWDFNIGFDNGDGRVAWDDWVINYNENNGGDAWSMPFWWQRFLEDPIFRSAVKTRWENLRSSVLSDASIINEIDQHADYLIENRAVERNYEKWDPNGQVDYSGSIESLKAFLDFRADWMDAEIAAF